MEVNHWYINGKLHRTDGPAIEGIFMEVKNGLLMENFIELMDPLYE